MKRFRKTIRDPETLHSRPRRDPFAKFDYTVDLHGMTSLEVERVLNNIISSKIGLKVLINHGKGEGILRTTVRSFCSKDPRVKKVCKGEDSLLPGGDGLTAIEL
jgi:dsDNA-specific endonuclease/ATPase MutS2